MSMLERFRQITAATAVGALMLMVTSAHGQEPIEMKVSLYTPPAGGINVEFKKIKESLEAESAGRIKVSIYESSQMGPPARQYDLVKNGVADVSILQVSLTPERFPLTELGTLPNIVPLKDGQLAPRVLSSAFLDVAPEYLASEFDGVKLVNFAIVPSDVLLTIKEVTTFEGIKNMRVRHGGAQQAQLMAAYGTVPVSVSAMELAEAFSRGQIDGMIGLYSTITAFQLQDSTKNVIGVPGGAFVFAVAMNPGFYEKIPADLKPLVDKYFGPEQQPKWSQFWVDEEANAKKKIEAAGVVVRSLSAADKDAVAEIAGQMRDKVLADKDAAGLPAKKFVDALRAAAAKYN